MKIRENEGEREGRMDEEKNRRNRRENMIERGENEKIE